MVLRATKYDQTYYHEHRAHGLDYLHYGDWQVQYGAWLAQAFGWSGKRVLDVGCACGGNLMGMLRADIDAIGIDLSEYMIQLGRATWPQQAWRLQVCDAVNLHFLTESSVRGIHIAQVAEHWRQDHVPLIMSELFHIAAAGTVMFVALDTTELFNRQRRQMEFEDPTHICIRPMAWWHIHAANAGWKIVTEDYQQLLKDNAPEWFAKYDWDYFVAAKD